MTKRFILKGLLAMVSIALFAMASTSHAALVAYYDFEDNGSGTTTDNVGGYVGTLNGGAAITSSGKYGSAVDVDGTGYVDGGHHSSFLVTQGTVMAWVNFDHQDPGPGAHDMQIAIMPAGETWDNPWIGLGTWIHPSGSNSIAQANWGGEGTNYQTDTSKGGVADDTWTHVAATYDGITLTHYVDGNLIDSVIQDGAIGYTGSPRLSIGTRNAQHPGNFFNGMIDEVKLFNTALTDVEIAVEMAPPSGTAPASEFTWQADDVGNWSNKNNWSYSGLPALGIANSSHHTVIFGDAITTNSTAVTNSDVTVNRVQFDNASHSYSISGHGHINFMATTDDSVAPATIGVLQGSHQFQAGVRLHSGTTVNVASGATLTFNNTLDLNDQTLTKTGVGTMLVRNDLVLGGGTLDISEGTVAGNGTIGGDVTNDSGTISPGNSSPAASAVPEPSAMLLLLGAVMMLLGRKWD